MENDEMALNQTNTEESVVDTTPVVEEQTAEETPIESTEPASEEEAVVEETDQQVKKGAQKRIRELSGEVKTLRQRLNEVTGQDGNDQPHYQPQQPQTLDLDGEVTPEQYRQHVLQQADNIVQLRLKQSEALSRIDKESQEVIQKYPQLDPESDDFDQDLNVSILEAIEAQVKLNPYSTSVKSIADKLMKPYLKAVSTGVEQEKATITKQVAETALRPTQVRKVEKSLNEMSIDELEAKLGIVQA
jgi:hypothetical protein